MDNQIMCSGTLPLTFCIRVVDRRTRGLEQAKKELAPVLRAMSRCSNRLHTLSLDVLFDTLRAFQHNNLPWHRLTRLRIHSSSQSPHQTNHSLPLMNPTASPTKIELNQVSIQSLMISWNRLTSATVNWVDFDDLMLLFRHVHQMTDCHVLFLDYGLTNLPMPQITHHRLKTLSLRNAIDTELAITVLDSLTVPCLREFHTNDVHVLNYLPKLMRQSFTSLTLYHDLNGLELPHRFAPFPGVTDLVVETPGEEDNAIKRLLFEGCFPNLHHLTLRLQSFLSLWEMGVIPLLLDRKRLQYDRPNESRLSKILVVERGKAIEFDRMWKSDVGEQLKALGISLREDGFEIL